MWKQIEGRNSSRTPMESRHSRQPWSYSVVYSFSRADKIRGLVTTCSADTWQSRIWLLMVQLFPTCLAPGMVTVSPNEAASWKETVFWGIILRNGLWSQRYGALAYWRSRVILRINRKTAMYFTEFKKFPHNVLWLWQHVVPLGTGHKNPTNAFPHRGLLFQLGYNQKREKKGKAQSLLHWKGKTRQESYEVLLLHIWSELLCLP